MNTIDKTPTLTVDEKQKQPDKNEPRTYHCNDCGAVIYRHQIFCPNCGKPLDRMDYVD